MLATQETLTTSDVAEFANPYKKTVATDRFYMWTELLQK